MVHPITITSSGLSVTCLLALGRLVSWLSGRLEFLKSIKTLKTLFLCEINQLHLCLPLPFFKLLAGWPWLTPAGTEILHFISRTLPVGRCPSLIVQPDMERQYY